MDAVVAVNERNRQRVKRECFRKRLPIQGWSGWPSRGVTNSARQGLNTIKAVFVAVYRRALQSTSLERDNSIEELADIALKLRERVNLSPHQPSRLVGVGLSKVREAEPSKGQPFLFE
jgi:hypothetical protein